MNAGYTPPLDAIGLALRTVGLGDVLDLPAYAHLVEDDVSAVLDGHGRFIAEVVAPTDAIGDRAGTHFDPGSGSVTVPPEVAAAHRRWVADGWSGLAMDPADGGGGFPGVVGTVAEEMFASANMALSLNPMLTKGAIHLLAEWGTGSQRERFVPRLVSGEWSGTMNLTEPGAGSDVGALTTTAVPRDDGTWTIHGTKTLITWGEHDLTDNIVHLVLARTPGAPPGTHGLSLFVVPKRRVADDGTVGEPNGVRCVGVESKLGIHVSPTCVLVFDGAVGELVGPEGGGMRVMFTMMNAARLSIGVEGLAVAERAAQQANRYAMQRRQGRTASTPPGESALIVEHPDVRRMLLLIESGIDASRLLIYATSVAADLARHAPDPGVRGVARARADLLTPLAKAWCTDEGVRLTSLALQVHGGAGYIEETGVAQRYRDARIAPIYEGTNGIQAIDLVSRKVCRDRGAALTDLLDELVVDAGRLDGIEGTGAAVEFVHDAIDAARRATAWMIDRGHDDDRLAGATPYLDLVALTVCGGLLARQLRRAVDDAASEASKLVGRFAFYATERLVTVPALAVTVCSGAGRLAAANLR